MDRSLLKNIIIIILVLVNLFLAASLFMRQNSAIHSRRQTETQLIELFAADGMTLDKHAFSRKTPPAPFVLSRSLQRERDAAVFFLGSSLLQEDQGGGTYTYTGDSGVARFRTGGTFEIAGTLTTGDPEAFFRSFCKTFSYETLTMEFHDNGTGSATAIPVCNDLAVFNCPVTFTVSSGGLMTVSGTLLPPEGSSGISETEPLSAAAALTVFQNTRRETGAVVSAVTELTLCYELQSTSTLTLAPSWCITTDTKNYYVNCITGSVTSEN
jgi:hypothetical protein